MFILLRVVNTYLPIISAVGFVWKNLSLFGHSARQARASSVPILATHFILIITPLLLIGLSGCLVP